MAPVETLVPIVFFLGSASVAIFWLLTRHKERIMMLDKGLKAEDIKALYVRDRSFLVPRPLSSLKWGILFLCVGLAGLIGVWLQQTYFFPDGVIPGLMSVFGGIGLIAFYFIAAKKGEPAV
jgi:hypothetical protein